MNQILNYHILKDRHRELRDDFPQALSLRTHRALSWLHRAEQESHDDDARFIFLWIAFNSAYANELHDDLRFSETRLFLHFLGRLIENDKEGRLYEIVWKEFPNAIRLLLDNRYVFQPFWEYQKGCMAKEGWERKFQRSKESAMRALGKSDTRKVLLVVFERLYVLRNQLFHGSATWNSSTNRTQLKQATAILDQLVPTIISIMLDSGNQLWGDPRYPVVD
ncbi:HEPN domain-containing protein [Thiolapillus brandeum]|uniref:Apea-like HEPN domain-containing protein n=1 Tax=Thiolapillus brandeum TaxID=1076588 RepID=A0A7U6GJW0_9GAMM|nr:HEPN domain-containing protein [Thiolapillus brandeum]BAO44987.1 conserved hypothetical protein [Thiolapillus brandeum]